MTPHRKKCPHVVDFDVPRDWLETNSQHQKLYSEGGKKIRGCRGLLGRVIQVHASRKKTHFKADISCISLANNRLMDVTQLALTLVG